MPTEPSLSKIADTVLKITALIGVSATIASFGYNYFLCTVGSYKVAFSVPVLLLSVLIFGIALGLTDKTFGTFRDLSFTAVPMGTRILRFALYLFGWLSEFSLFSVAFYSIRVSASVPNCLS